MSKQTVEFIFSIRQQVRILALGQMGHVSGLLRDSDGRQYRIVYWYDGQRRCEWMHESELEAPYS